ncbi:MAG: hypothetical protein J6A96_05975 [Clostridia bacterium]|nr:hypothetical protein [Clostridia bacterium]
MITKLSQNSDNGSTNLDFSTTNTANITENDMINEKNIENQQATCKNEPFFDTNSYRNDSITEPRPDHVSDNEVNLLVKNDDCFSDDSSLEEENESFSRLFPGVSKENVENDRVFKLFREINTSTKPFCELYSDYLSLYSVISKELKIKNNILYKAQQASPGSLCSGESYDDGFFTKDQVLRMSKEQIAKNYEKIRKSQQKW